MEITNRPPQLILILGGARSGKSTFAEQLAKRSKRRVAFIATATASDAEMSERIQQHRASRPADWLTIEEPLDLASAIRRAAPVADIMLLDCITLWLSNLLVRAGNLCDDEIAVATARYHDEALAAIDTLLATFTTLDAGKTLIVVSNEVGLGIVPTGALSRLYRDVLGRVNQHLAAAAARVYLMVAGLGVDIKRLHDEARLG
ncbi:MAG: bifunctional adenosylcobinamide kinase/adenosylcobinamide-phosphate guanylyltransferase [Ktedonobacteraceae bacterium]|nr:bifunctional adenosylcobinamide kinase/adenosylcobinamide-phosphate guanylyltransferase [Ktedonobacteraceae bacterium]